MCGISGIHGLEQLTSPEAIVGRMNDAMAHRGPDAAGVWRGGNVVLGHRRLSIIDLSHDSDQPFHSMDGRYAIAFNGEIYNYRALKAELTGVSWRTGSDTEVLLEAYARWGFECLHRLEGMFAFAVHDAVTDELVLVRDRMGIKPLYWYRDDKRLLFASEIRALLASDKVPRRLDRDALVDHLRYQTVHAPATMVKDVRMLQAGHWMRIADQEVSEGRWYDPVEASRRQVLPNSLPEIHHEVKGRLARAVEKRLVSDVPFGAFLSGGIDSTTIAALAARHQGKGYASEAATGLPVLEAWREQTVRKLNVAIDAMQRLRQQQRGIKG